MLALASGAPISLQASLAINTGGQARGRMCRQVVTLPRLHLPASDLGLAVVRQTGTYTESRELGQYGQTCACHLQRDKPGLGTHLLSQHLISSNLRWL